LTIQYLTRMIVIFTESDDMNTDAVIDLLRFHGIKWKRINGEEDLEDINPFFLNSTEFLGEALVGQKKSEALTFWFRRPGWHIIEKSSAFSCQENDIEYPTLGTDSQYLKIFQRNFVNYQRIYLTSLFNNLDRSIGCLNYYRNKIDVLRVAEKIGLKIPPTIITGKKIELIDFYNRYNGDIICKSLYEILNPSAAAKDGFLIRSLTAKVDELNTMPESFYPSLFQQNIQKKYELRIFYLRGKCYSSAIFSQQNEKTKTDFRNYDLEFPNRMVPYQLPEYLEAQLKELMERLKLNTGSIDIMRGVDKKYYFLEVNPVGQYDFVSVACNYQLDKRIFEQLIELDGREN